MWVVRVDVTRLTQVDDGEEPMPRTYSVRRKISSAFLEVKVSVEMLREN